MTGKLETSEAIETAAEDRAWRVARYVLGELSEADSEALELAMLDDAGLCELVVDATRLQAGIALACRETSLETAPPGVRLSQADSASAFAPVRSQGFRTVVSLAGLGLAGILLTFAIGSDERPSRDLAVVNAETVDALADLISESESDTSELLASQDVDADVDLALSEVATPQWLLTAIELEFGGGQPQSSEDSDVY